MVTAGCMALCIQTDNTACEARGNYRGVGGDGSALFLPSPQIFGQLKTGQAVGAVGGCFGSRSPSCCSSFLLALWLAELEQLDDTEQPPASRGVALPGLGRAPKIKPWKDRVSIRHWGREDWEGEQQLMACGQSLLRGKDLLTFTLHLLWKQVLVLGNLGRAYQKRSRESIMLRET